jgi:hypothetical protein
VDDQTKRHTHNLSSHYLRGREIQSQPQILCAFSLRARQAARAFGTAHKHPDYIPKLAFVIVQEKHHVRIFNFFSFYLYLLARQPQTSLLSFLSCQAARAFGTAHKHPDYIPKLAFCDRAKKAPRAHFQPGPAGRPGEPEAW